MSAGRVSDRERHTGQLLGHSPQSTLDVLVVSLLRLGAHVEARAQLVLRQQPLRLDLIEPDEDRLKVGSLDPPGEVIEAARVDGAGHGQIFFRIILPLTAPAIASVAIFQFLWVWNDLLVALIFADGNVAPITKLLAEMTGSRGQDWYLLTAGAFIALIVPLIVFLSLQRFFVRGLLAGATKG